MKSRITCEQEKQIVDYYLSGLSCEEIAFENSVSWKTIRVILIKKGIKLTPLRPKSKLSSFEILEMYTNGISIEEISLKAEVKYQAIWKRLKKAGVKFPRGISRKYQINETFFDSWSYEMAYILGFIYADGCMPQNRHSIRISQNEKPILVEIAKYLCMPEKSITKKRNQYYLTVNSVKMCRSLCWHGVKPNKSLTIDFPKVSSRYMGAFLRGVIDGDGWVDKAVFRVVVYTGSKEFADGLCDAFKQLNLNARIRRDKKGCYGVTVSKKAHIALLCEILYKNKGNLYLERKYKRMIAPTRKRNSIKDKK